MFCCCVYWSLRVGAHMPSAYGRCEAHVSVLIYWQGDLCANFFIVNSAIRTPASVSLSARGGCYCKQARKKCIHIRTHTPNARLYNAIYVGMCTLYTQTACTFLRVYFMFVFILPIDLSHNHTHVCGVSGPGVVVADIADKAAT